jgi:GNAT superfamily N-acetyltransferase
MAAVNTLSQAAATTQAQLAAEVELNSAEWLELEGIMPWVEVHQEPDVLWLITKAAWPRSHVGLARFSIDSAERRVGEILDHYLAAGVACDWIVGPASQPADLGRYLKLHGFSCRIHCAGMACELETLDLSPVHPPKNVTIGLVGSPPPLRRISTERRRLRDQGRTILAGMSPRRLWHFLATAEGAPVGETTLFDGTTVAGLYNVEVIEEFRGRGIGTALVQAALLKAQQLGHAKAVLAANGMGAGVYARCGFREVGRLSFWRFSKKGMVTGAY